jgi:lysophospholipase L1-like esterase
MKLIARTLLFSSLFFLSVQSFAQGSAIRVVILGSSTAVGCCAPGGQGWVDVYRTYLTTLGRPTEVINLAVGGNTTFEVLPTDYVSPYRSLQTAWNRAPNVNANITKALSYNPTHIIINLPTNDADLALPVAYQLVHYEEIVARANARNIPVYVTTTQPRNLGAAGRQLLMGMRDATFSRFGSNAIDFWNGLANADGTIMAAYNYDGVHMNAAGHLILCERVRGTVRLDATVAGGNVVTNGGFEAGTSPWGFYTNGSGTMTTIAGGTEGAKSARIAIAVQGINVQLNQTGVALASNTKYLLSFDAYCTSGHDVSVSVVKNVAPYTNYGLSSMEFNLETSWGHFSTIFSTGDLGGNVADGRLMFWLAPYDAAGDEYYFDNVVLTKAGGTTSTAPTITLQPQTQTVTAGQTATFSVSATGTTPLWYQWQKNSADISGATGSSFTTGALSTADNGTIYRVIVSNSAGSVTSNGATLTVSSATTGTPQLAGNVLTNGGFESGTSPWYFYTNGSWVFSPVAGGTEGSSAVRITIVAEGTNVQMHQVGMTLASNTKYQLSFDAYCTSGHDVAVSLVKNVSPYTSYGLSGMEFNLGTAWGHYSVTFSTGDLGGTVTDGRLMFWLAPYDAAGDQFSFDNIVLAKSDGSTNVAPVISSHPQNQTVVAGQTATFSVAATGTAPLSYQWQKNNASISGATSPSYTTAAVTSGDNGSTYRVIVSNGAGSATSNGATLTVNSSSGGGTTTVSTGNLIANGGFEAGTSSWFFYTNGAGSLEQAAGGTAGASSVKIAITAEGTNVQLHQVGVTLSSNTRYTLSFDAYCTSGHDLSVSILKNTSPYTSYGLSSAEFNLGTSWQHFSTTFTTGSLGGTVADGRLMFWIAPYDAAGDQYFFDNIVLTPAASAGVANAGTQASEEGVAVESVEAVPTHMQLYQNYPNPFNPSTTISFDIPVQSHVRLTIYDVLGREVESLVDGEWSAGAYHVQWDGSRFSSGVYFCRLQAEKAGSDQPVTTFLRKLILSR